MYAINQESIKQINKVNILNILRKHKEITKYEIAERLNISIPTVTTNINLLMEQNLVEEVGIAESTGGRKPVMISLKKNGRYSVGVNISPKDIRIILMNLYSEVVDEIKLTYDKNQKFESVLKAIMLHIQQCLNKHSIEQERILGIGFALPGIVDEENLLFVSGPNIGVKNFSFKQLQEQTGFEFYIENEANSAAYGEFILGIANSNLVYISITEGVGTGIIINHKVYKSIFKKAGEFGHMRVTNDKIQCSCGRYGCWELYTSIKALLRHYKFLSGEEILQMEELFARYKQDDRFAKEALEQYVYYLHVGIENIIVALDPQYVVIGGDIAAYKNEIEDLISKYQFEESSIMDHKNQIVFSLLKDRASLLGSGLLPFEALFHFTSHVL
jgi:predicted NBD/HSP70 family sugar kinase